MADRLQEFQSFRQRLNERILTSDHLGMKRFFALDHQAYQPGALSVKIKELLGLVASMVLRCDDCISYHLVRCSEEGVTDEEFFDAFNVALIVGGSITVPHLRRAVDMLDQIRAKGMLSGGGKRKKKRRSRAVREPGPGAQRQ